MIQARIADTLERRIAEATEALGLEPPYIGESAFAAHLKIARALEYAVELKKALGFYADSQSWNVCQFVVKAVDREQRTVTIGGFELGDKTCIGRPAEEDAGERARRALKGAA